MNKIRSGLISRLATEALQSQWVQTTERLEQRLSKYLEKCDKFLLFIENPKDFGFSSRQVLSYHEHSLAIPLSCLLTRKGGTHGGSQYGFDWRQPAAPPEALMRFWSE
jgi:hypothetical protein